MKRVILIGCLSVLTATVAGAVAIGLQRHHRQSHTPVTIDHDPPWVTQHEPVGWVFGRMIGVQPSAYPTIGPSFPNSAETLHGPRPDFARPSGQP